MKKMEASSHASSNGAALKAESKKASNLSKANKGCRQCGQLHSHHEPHLYNYIGEVDEDLMCQICLQPFVQPLDTPCGHTFCHVCMHNYLKVNPMCPLDRKPLNEMTCSPSNLVLKRLLDKLPVSCPNADSCEEEVQRGNLDDHLRYRCSGTLVACQFAASGCDYRGPTKSMAKHQTECRFKKEEKKGPFYPRRSGVSSSSIAVVYLLRYKIQLLMKDEEMTQLYLCEEPYWSKYDQSDLYEHPIEINIISDGITRLPVLEGEVSHVEIPRTSPSLGITIVGGADTPLRCVVVQEVFPDGLIAQDGRLRPGDQIIEINGADMTCANHLQVCAALRKMTSVLRLGVYRERIEKYGGRPQPNSAAADRPQTSSRPRPPIQPPHNDEDLLTITVERQAGKHLGIRLTGNLSEPGIYIADIQEGSAIGQDGRLQKFDRILFINGQDVRNSELSQASALIQNNDKLSLVVGRRKLKPRSSKIIEAKSSSSSSSHPKSSSFSSISHSRSRSEPAIQSSAESPEVTNDGGDSSSDSDDEDTEVDDDQVMEIPMHRQQPQPQVEVTKVSRRVKMEATEVTEVTEDDYLAIYETLDRKVTNDNSKVTKSHSMEDLETPTPSLRSFDLSDEKGPPNAKQPQVVTVQQDFADFGGCASMSSFLKKALRLEGPQLTQRSITIKKNVRESLGMRIGGGIGSNEGDTPIYVANIHPHGCIGKCKQLKKGDILLSVDGTSLCGLTHSQAVASLKATIHLDQVVLGVMEGPETSFGASNFIPSWMYWQKLPRNLQYPKTVILHRKEHASWGFSIVGGADPGSGRPTEPIHVLFVVPESPAAKDGKLKCGDRLLAVDGQSLENIPHHVAVSMLKRTSTRVVTEVVSWMGTEL